VSQGQAERVVPDDLETLGRDYGDDLVELSLRMALFAEANRALTALDTEADPEDSGIPAEGQVLGAPRGCRPSRV